MIHGDLYGIEEGCAKSPILSNIYHSTAMTQAAEQKTTSAQGEGTDGRHRVELATGKFSSTKINNTGNKKHRKRDFQAWRGLICR